MPGMKVGVVAAFVGVGIGVGSLSLDAPGRENKGARLMPVNTPARLGVGTPGMVKAAELTRQGIWLVVVAGCCLEMDTTLPPAVRPVWAI